MTPRLVQQEGETFAWNPHGAGWFSSSMGRGLAILECFTPARPVLGVIDIADELGMSGSTVHRYMSTLVLLGYLKQDPSPKYSLTLAVTRLGLSATRASSLREDAHPFLHKLRQETSYTTAIAILDWPEALYIERLPDIYRGHISANLPPVPHMPVYCTAMGKVLLASLPKPEQNTLIAELKLKRHTPNTITSKTELRAELNTLTEQGIAINDQEHTPGVHAIAAPIRDESGVLAAICLAASTSRITLEEMVDHLTPHLLSTASHISARLGYRRANERSRYEGADGR